MALLETRDKLINQITNFVHQQYEKMSMLEHYLELLEKERENSLEDEKTYVDNPINAFILIKRLTLDLDLLESHISDSPDLEIDKDGYPDMNDLVGATIGLERLRETYKLNITEMANGILKSAKSTLMLPIDCIDLARVLYQQEMYDASIDWLAQALLKYGLRKLVSPVMLLDILSGLTHSYEELDDKKNIQLWERRTVTIQNFDKFKSYREMAEELIKKQSSPRLSTLSIFPEYFASLRLCRGEMNISRDIQSKLKCFYINRNNPFLKLAPFKLEQLYINPDVDMVHDAMNDNEIQHFIDIATPEMRRARDIKFIDQYADYRVAQTAWFNPGFSDIVDRVSKRMADFSGLDLASAEGLQVANYGIGGQYEAHYDHSFEKLDFTENGDRYATILFYRCACYSPGSYDKDSVRFSQAFTLGKLSLTVAKATAFPAELLAHLAHLAVQLSDVTYGGGTAFTKLGLTVPPKKGAAIFWRNILPTGEGDNRTQHAACPVLLGNKWVLNRWLHEAGQEFSSPCTKDQKSKA